MATIAMKTMADRFRRWYEHERDCNGKIVGMLESVPRERRDGPEFGKALGKATHLIVAREIWLSRLGHFEGAPTSWETPVEPLETMAARFARIEGAWAEYLARLDDAELARGFEFGERTGRWRWDVEGILTQVHGHAWYHRGQIASLVAAAGGKAVDTDYGFWAGVERVG